ncbi:MAG: hypothetical protein DRQ88_04745 [Epsilonproteobacteria bacterium]|nr:MAG: hypothetical protein DRQ89_06930 [Campylobacterota bacterium]RLA66946.1 MAG: hypothetical protein DRQ88_04745 [Campylobacterota bacterium]
MKILLLLLLIPQLTFAIKFEQTDDLAAFTNTSGNKLVTNLYQVRDKNLERFNLEIKPWKGYHWPIALGLLANRYNDPNFFQQATWRFYHDQFIQNQPEALIAEGKINQLSPAEKYDLLIGDDNFSLTKKMWEAGEGEMERVGKITRWAGISHGVSLASMNMPMPKNPVKIWSVGKKYLITFSPDDLKALGALLWGPGAFNASTLGQRCAENTPARDNNGRPNSSECFDVHPAKFHLALINYLGVKKKPFYFDGSFNASIWHYPALGYEFKYFNPRKPQWQEPLKNAIIAKKHLRNDRFAMYREDKVKYIVGVQAKILFNPYRLPNREINSNNPRVNVYRYDLELDADHNIIGGEWYSTRRPDFIWHPPKGFKPKTPIDSQMSGNWSPTKRLLSAKWAKSAKEASARGVVTPKIVNVLFNLSNKGLNGYQTR